MPVRLSEAELETAALDYGLSESAYFSEYMTAGYIAGYRKALADSEAWVDVRERVPEDYGLYLVISQGKHIRVDFFAAGTWAQQPEVTHWQPLPPPPKQAEAANE